MLTIKKELNLQDFINEYDDILPNDYEAYEIIFDSLCETMEDGMEDVQVKDYIRFKMNISTQKELLSDYNIIDEDEFKDLDNDEIHEKIENYLNYNTYYLGSYEDNDGETVYIYDEF